MLLVRMVNQAGLWTGKKSHERERKKRVETYKPLGAESDVRREQIEWRLQEILTAFSFCGYLGSATHLEE